MPGRGGIQAHAADAEPVAGVCRHARPVIGDRDADAVGHQRGTDLDRIHGPFRGILQEIAQELGQIVGVDGDRQRLVDSDHPGEPAAARRALEGLDELAHAPVPAGVAACALLPTASRARARSRSICRCMSRARPSMVGCRLGVAFAAQRHGFGVEDGERGLEAVRQVGGLGAGAGDGHRLRLEQAVDLIDQRLDLARVMPLQPRGLPRADQAHGPAQLLEGAKAEPDLGECCGDQHESEQRQRPGELSGEGGPGSGERGPIDGSSDPHRLVAFGTGEDERPFVDHEQGTARAGQVVAVDAAGAERVRRQGQHVVPERA